MSYQTKSAPDSYDFVAQELLFYFVLILVSPYSQVDVLRVRNDATIAVPAK